VNRSRNPLNTPKSIESTTIQIICLLVSSCGYNYVRTYGRPASGIKSRDPHLFFLSDIYLTSQAYRLPAISGSNKDKEGKMI
jgi:hypothetical protein